MTALVLAAVAAYGVFLTFTALTSGWTGITPGPRRRTRPRQRGGSAREWLRQAGIDGVEPREFAAVVSALFIFGSVMAYAVFGGLLPALVAGVFAASFPVASYRGRRLARRTRASQAWPRVIEEIRLLTGSAGRSIPTALLDAGLQGPPEMRRAFADAQREWLLSTDFARTLDVLTEQLADPTADTVCETLLIAQELGGSDLDLRLKALIEDRTRDLQGRKDADARQAGARFARWFVLGVPAGMALAGMSIGEGRVAYQSTQGQVLVAIAIGLVVVCWIWASRVMRLPPAERVFG